MPTDLEIERAAQRALDWDGRVPSNVEAKVRSAWLTLDGLAATESQRSAAEEAVRYVAGARGVTNAIRVAPATVAGFYPSATSAGGPADNL